MKRWLNLILLIYCTRWTPLTKAQCPTGAGFQPMTTAQGCTCVYTGAVPVGVTVLSSQQFCLNLDNRSSLIAVNGDAQKNAIDSQMGGYVGMMGLYNVPASIWVDETNTQVHFMNNQITTDPLMGLVGKCYFLFTNGQYATNNSCLMYPPHIICQMMCGTTYPPPGIRADGVSRCGQADFNITCQNGWINLGGLCYKNPVNNSTLLTYADAESACASVGGWLPTFSNLQEWQAVVNYVFYTGISGPDSYAAPMWLGGMYNGTSLNWNDGTPTTFQYWAPGQPSSSYSCAWWSVGQGSYWSTGDCSFPHGVVFCQWYQCPTTTSTTTTTTMTTTTTAQPTTTTTPLTTTTTSSTTTTSFSTTVTTPSTTTTSSSTTITTPSTTTTSSFTTITIPSTTTTSPSTTITTPSTTTTSPSTTITTPSTTTTSPSTTITTPSTTTTSPSTTITTPSTITTSSSTTSTTPSTTTISPSTTVTTPLIITTTTTLGSISSPTTMKVPSTSPSAMSSTTTTTATDATLSRISTNISTMTTSTFAVVAATSTLTTVTTSKAPNTTTDFSSMCNSDPMSFYSNGICYTFYPTNKTAIQAAADCASRGTAMAVVRSADIAENFINYYTTVYPNNDVMTAWIGTPTNATDYNQLQNTVCTDGSCWLHVSIASGQCTALSNVVTSSDVWIVDNVSCTSAFPYFCEKLSIFEQKGCGQSLNGVVVQSVTLATTSLCAEQCATYDWCTGVNYNQTGQLCQILKENSTIQSLTCYNGWEYFERL